MNNKSPEFKALQARWYQKLSDKGFKDIEYDEDHLRKHHAEKFLDEYDEIRFNARTEYYQMASDFLNTHKFKNRRQRVIWELHADGMAIREIVRNMTKRGFKAYKFLVHTTIQELAAKMIGRKPHATK